MKRGTHSWAFWSYALLVCLVFMIWTGRAAAAEYVPPAAPTEPKLEEGFPVCPETPTEYTGEDQAVAELRAIRIEDTAVCRALRYRLDLIRERQFWIVLEQIEQGKREGQLDKDLLSLLPAIEKAETPKTQGVSWSAALPVEDEKVASNTAYSSEAIDASGQADNEVLWFLAGLGTIAFAAFGLYKTLWEWRG